MKENILGFQVDLLNIEDCVSQIFSSLFSNHGIGWLACLNPHSYVISLDDEEFARALNSADWLVPDGVGIVYASRLLGGAINLRVTGSDIFHELHSRMNSCVGMSVFFLGSTDVSLSSICSRMAIDYPHVRVVGTYSPPFKPEYSQDELDYMLRVINESEADVLWVGMTAPKQEKWIYENRARLKVKFAGAIGAVFDFYSGRVQRSHPIFQRLGLEWLPRLLQQPRRLWRRMFVSAPIFLWHVLRAKATGHLNAGQ